jgi:hypothetical protein
MKLIPASSAVWMILIDSSWSGLRESLRQLLDLDFDHLFFAHGDPLIGGGKTALRQFLDR